MQNIVFKSFDPMKPSYQNPESFRKDSFFLKYLLYFFILSFLIISQDIRPRASDAAVQALSDDLETTHIGPPAPTQISQDIQPGFFYRVGPATAANPEPVIGVYAKSVKYYSRPLTEGEAFETMRTHVFAQKAETNYLGICFLGVWSFQEEGKERFQVVQVPVRTLDAKKMLRKKDDGSTTFSARYIWKTGHSPMEVKTEEGNKFQHVPCKGTHTEPKAIEYLEDKETQKALWAYFLWQTENDKVPKKKRTLDCIGFQFFSTLDACDSCLKALVSFQQRRLAFCPPREEGSYTVNTLSDPVPFLITFISKRFYRPDLYNWNDLHDNSVCSASLLFYPRPRLLRLGAKIPDEDTHNIQGLPSEEEIAHQDSVLLEEKEEFNFIVLMVNQGKSVKVSF